MKSTTLLLARMTTIGLLGLVVGACASSTDVEQETAQTTDNQAARAADETIGTARSALYNGYCCNWACNIGHTNTHSQAAVTSGCAQYATNYCATPARGGLYDAWWAPGCQ